MPIQTAITSPAGLLGIRPNPSESDPPPNPSESRTAIPTSTRPHDLLSAGECKNIRAYEAKDMGSVSHHEPNLCDCMCIHHERSVILRYRWRHVLNNPYTCQTSLVLAWGLVKLS